MSMLFERFVSRERDEPPDIDVDFEHQRREEVIQYIYNKYGRDRAALAATVITYRAKSALRDVGRALGFENALLDRLARSMSWWDGRKAIPERMQEAGLDPQSEINKLLFLLINLIIGFPRHLSQHVGGFIISQGPLERLVSTAQQIPGSGASPTLTLTLSRPEAGEGIPTGCVSAYVQGKQFYWSLHSYKYFLIAIVLALAGLITGAHAQSYPTKTVRIIVGFPPGGATDIATRAVAQKLTENFGQQVIVENRPGAASNIGAEFVARSAPDGYTILMGSVSLSINPSLF